MLILLVMSMFLAIGLNPVVEPFMRRGLRRGLSVLLVLVVVISVLALFVVAIAPVISEQIAQITRNAPGWLDDLQSNGQVQKLDDQYDVIAKARDYIENGDFGQKVFGGALGVGLQVLSALANSLIVLVLMIYFLASLPSIKHAGYSLAPASKRAPGQRARRQDHPLHRRLRRRRVPRGPVRRAQHARLLVRRRARRLRLRPRLRRRACSR